jgi:hypothetical protein
MIQFGEEQPIMRRLSHEDLVREEKLEFKTRKNSPNLDHLELL